MLEKIKNLLIVLLGLLMVVQLGINLTLGLEDHNLLRLQDRLNLGNRTEQESVTFSEPAIRPAKLTIRGPGGLYLAAGNDTETLLTAVSPILSEALGSVGKIEAITDRQFLTYLSGEHIGFSFTHAVPFYLLQHWWTGETGFSSDQSASTLAVVSDEGKVALAFCDSASGRYYLAETAAGYERFISQCESAPAGNAFYAFEQDGYHMLTAYEPVWSQSVWFPTYTAAVPDFSAEGGISEGLLSAFDINAFLAEVYKERDGDIVYIEGHTALQFSKEGLILYSVTGDDGIDLEMESGLSEKEQQAYAARRACEILERISASAGCGGGFSVAEITARENGWVIAFERALGGGFITETDGYSAVVTVERGRITGIRTRLSTATEGPAAMLLPIRLATALLDGGQNGFWVRYTEQDGVLVPDLFSTQGDR